MAKKVRKKRPGLYTALDNLFRGDDHPELEEVATAKAVERERRILLVTSLAREGYSVGKIATMLDWPIAMARAYSQADVGWVEIMPLPAAVRAMREGVI